MTPDQWRRVGELFHEALDRPPGERTAFAGQACTGDPEVQRELISLLDNDRAAGGFVERQVKSAVVSLFEGESSRHQRIGAYKLLVELGRGGMGTVYLAERDDAQYQTKVAIKLVRPGMDTDIILTASAASARRWHTSSIPTSPACWMAALPRMAFRTSSWSISPACRSRSIVTLAISGSPKG